MLRTAKLPLWGLSLLLLGCPSGDPVEPDLARSTTLDPDEIPLKVGGRCPGDPSRRPQTLAVRAPGQSPKDRCPRLQPGVNEWAGARLPAAPTTFATCAAVTYPSSFAHPQNQQKDQQRHQRLRRQPGGQDIGYRFGKLRQL